MIPAAIVVTILALWMTGNLALRSYVERRMPLSQKPHITQRIARTRLWLVVLLASVVLCGLVWMRAAEVSPTGLVIALVVLVAVIYMPRLYLWYRKYMRPDERENGEARSRTVRR